MSLEALNSDTLVDYLSDRGTGRARLPLSLFETHQISLGWVIALRLDIGGKNVDVVCSAWPDTACVLGPSNIAVDVSVITPSLSAKTPPWESCSCQIMKSYPPKPVSSFRIRVASSNSLKAVLTGLPVFPNSTILTSEHRHRIQSVHVLEGNPIGVCTLGSLAINSREDENNGGQHPFSSTTVTRTIIARIVDPVVSNVPRQARVRGVLLFGPPGTGKTVSALAVRHLCRGAVTVNVFPVSLADLLALPSEESLRALREAFQRASSGSGRRSQSPLKTPTAKQLYSVQRKSMSPDSTKSPNSFYHADLLRSSTPLKSPISSSAVSSPEVSLIVLDEVDALGGRGCSSDTQIAIKQFICSWFDAHPMLEVEGSVECCIIGTTNRLTDVDFSLRRGGRFEIELEVSSAINSSASDRKAILLPLVQETCETLHQDSDIDYDTVAGAIANATGGYVAADLIALHREVLNTVLTAGATSRLVDRSERCNTSSFSGLSSTTSGVLEAYMRCMRKVAPSALRGATITVPDLSLDDVIGLHQTKRSLLRLLSFYDPVKRDLLRQFKLRSPGGALLYGPPGNSKTRLVMACASSYRIPVITLSVADVYSPYVGDAEAEVRRGFALARQSAPCILFLDEIDALVTDRTIETSSTGAESRVLATLLTEIDGLGSCNNEGIIVLGATNRLNAIDSALLRKVIECVSKSIDNLIFRDDFIIFCALIHPLWTNV